MSFVSSSEASKYYNVTGETLRRWAINGQINHKTTEGGHRRYEIRETRVGKCIIYARVSSAKQTEDLERQVKYLKRKYPSFEIIRDIGSGINFKRKGLKYILEQLFERNIREIVVSSADRFSRIGTEQLFGWIFEYFGAKLTILNKKGNKSANEELADDLLEVITVFTARYHGKRKYKDSEGKVLS